jgi:YggT family protein
MFALGYLFTALGNVVDTVIQVYIIVIIIRALISWVSPDPYNPIVRFLYRITEPVLRPIRHRLPTMAMGLDLSPAVVILLLMFLQRFLVPVLYRMGTELS